jgi:fumarate reductase flavoprotein subunit
MNLRMETDAVVIGSGAAGLAAAITFAELGLKVIVFEKQPSVGGTSNFFNGTFAVESLMQKAEYIAYSRDQAFRNYMEYNHWLVNARLVRTLIDRSAETIEWLMERGVIFTGVTINMPDAPRTYHVIRGGGEAVVKALVTKAREKGAELSLGTPVKNILKKNKAIAGVVAEVDGEDIEVACRTVVIASGGYANNMEWIKKYAHRDLGVNVFPLGNTGKMGDGIRMAWEMGAGSDGMGVLHVVRVAPFGEEFPFMNVVEGVAIQPILWVNPQGRRFCDEGIAHYDTSAGNVNSLFDKGYTWSVFDDHIKNHYIDKGLDRGVAQIYLPGAKLKNLNTELEYMLSLNSPELFSADSIELLAVKMGVDPQVLKSTIEEYNGFCAKGRDDLFAKDPAYLNPLKGPRFYAARGRTCYLGTLGGIRINEKTEVVDKNDVAIPGLYAAGNDMGGLHAESYSMRDSSGAASAFALISGRMAGENAVAYLKLS